MTAAATPIASRASSRWLAVVPWVLFLAVLAFSAVVVGMAGLSAAAFYDDSLHDRLHDWAVSESLWGRAAERMADSSHATESAPQLALDFGFSLMNLVFAGLLFWLRPRDRTAHLLAFGLVGTAAVFNLQAHLVYETLDANTFETATHDGFTLVAGLSYVFALLLFPDGRVVPRWPKLALVALYGAIAAVVAAIALGAEEQSRTASIVTLFGVLAPVAGVSSQAYRHQATRDPVERQQSRLLFWVLVPALAVGLYALVIGTRSTTAPELQGRELLILPVTIFRVFQPVFFLIPVALLVGIFRFRLWDVDKLISRALVYSVLAGFVSIVYVGMVVGAGSIVGRTDTGNVPLSIAATFLVAVTFGPVKERVQRVVNRLVFGSRATPYEVLSGFAERVGESVATDELLERMARVLAEGTGAVRAIVWLKVGEELRPAAMWSTTTLPDPGPITLVGDDLPEPPEGTRLVPVRHQDELYGALSVRLQRGNQPSMTELKLVDDLARQAGLVLRNRRLNDELLERLEELKASRQRLVSVQDEERRKIERNLHDGAQQQLVALKVHLSLAEDLADEIGDEAQPLLDVLAQVKAQASGALEELRDLARGIYPPLLAAEGLPTALASQARKAAVPIEVNADGVGRYPQDVEAAVYFCVLEAIQNVSKYAGACSVEIDLTQRDGALEFEVRDDGCGFDLANHRPGAGVQNMADRIEALEGTFAIESTPDGGTTIKGCIPVVV